MSTAQRAIAFPERNMRMQMWRAVLRKREVAEQRHDLDLPFDGEWAILPGFEIEPRELCTRCGPDAAYLGAAEPFCLREANELGDGFVALAHDDGIHFQAGALGDLTILHARSFR